MRKRQEDGRIIRATTKNPIKKEREEGAAHPRVYMGLWLTVGFPINF
jgi:hypothetical protein